MSSPSAFAATVASDRSVGSRSTVRSMATGSGLRWWIETLSGFVADGFDTLVLWPVDTSPEQVELLADALVPYVRHGLPAP